MHTEKTKAVIDLSNWKAVFKIKSVDAKTMRVEWDTEISHYENFLFDMDGNRIAKFQRDSVTHDQAVFLNEHAAFFEKNNLDVVCLGTDGAD